MRFVLATAAALLATALSANAQSGFPAYIGQLLIQPALSNSKCVTAASDTDGAAVTIQPCTGASNQKWTFSSGQVRVFTNKCLDVTGGVDVGGTKLQIWTCSTPGDKNQNFFYSYWDYRLQWKNTDKCVDLTKSLLADGTPVQIWSCANYSISRIWNTGYMANQLPAKSEAGQSGTNSCGTGNSQTSQCQTAWMNSATDFCLWGPPDPNSTVGDTERVNVAWCLQPGRGTRLIPNGTLKGVHFVKTKDYVQVTGAGDFTKINIKAGDDGGELDPHGADGNGNPIGGLLYGNTFGASLQYHEWTSFMSSTEFCFRACIGPNAAQNCQHIYDVMGCYWNMPANYNAGTFEECDADNDLPMGVYGTSTWHQGVSPTPGPHPAASSSNCKTLATVTSTPTAAALKKRRLEYRAPSPAPTAMPS